MRLSVPELRSRVLLCLALLISCLPSQAQIPPVPQGFPRNQSYTPGRLLYRSAPGQARITNIIYHNGLLYTNMVTGADRKIWRWTDVNNPASLTMVSNASNIPLYNDQGNHAHYKVGDYFGGFYDLAIKRDSPGNNIFVRSPDWSAVSSGRRGSLTYFPWSLPFRWIQYDGLSGSNTAFITRGNTTLYEWDALGKDGVIGTSILIGNLLFICSDESNLGILCYDISPVFKSPAEPPILLDKLTGNFGAYLTAPWENYLILARRDNNKVEVIDYSDPTDLRHVTSIDISGTPALFGNGSTYYVQAQDNFIFAAHHKINMETFQKVLELDQVGNNRPPGSASGRIDTSQYMLPLGNLLVTGGYTFDGEDCVGVWAHQAEPDTRKPYVGYHVPRPGQTNYPPGAPISLLIHETLESYTIINGVSVILREVGTATPLDCWISFSHDDVLTITPKQYLQPNKTYEVVIPDGGIKDAVGNGIEAYRFTFSTGSSVSGGNAGPTITGLTAGPSPAAPNTSISFSATATDPEGDTLQYRFNFGDGTASTAWSATRNPVHTYTAPGHYDVKLQVRDVKPDGSHSVVARSLTVTVATMPSGPAPTHSSTIALDRANRRVWVANADADTVTILNADTHARISEINLRTVLGTTGRITPRNVAVDAGGHCWVTCHDADRIAVLNSSGGLVGTINLDYGSGPSGVATSPDGTAAYVTLQGSGLLKRYATATRTETGSLAVGPTPRAIAITSNGARVLLTRFLSDLNHAMVWDVNAGGSTLSLTRTYRIVRDRSPDGPSNGRGTPNYLTGITISPDGAFAWITATKPNDQHGSFFTGPMSTDNTMRALIVRLKLDQSVEQNINWDKFGDRIDVDNSDSPSSIVFSPHGDWAFAALQGNNEIAVFDDLFIRAGGTKSTKWRFDSDLAPQGMVFDPTTNKLFVNNFMARNVTIHNLANFISRGDRAASVVKVNAVATETLPATVLAGKRIFYNASKRNAAGEEMISRDTYISCASCHLDGGHDGRVWDFTQRGEGLRNTIDLRGKGGMAHGNLHWSANFDEVQDFENDIRDHFGGKGLIHGTTVSSPLGTPKTGLNPELDQLAAYVSSLNHTHIPRSPWRNADGSNTAAAIAGQQVFQRENCASCHSGSRFTDSTGGVGISPTLHDVGTLRTSSGQRNGTNLPGIDTPTLLGLHAGGPYLHDGSARTLIDVFTVAGGVVYQAESGAVSGSASRRTDPNDIRINGFNSVHRGGCVAWGDTSGTWTLNNVDGGPTSGSGAIELRYVSTSNQTLTLVVNGISYTASLTNGLNEPGWLNLPHWQTVRVENVALNAGTGNTIGITRSGGGFQLDGITVSTPALLARAAPHRRVLNLSTTERNDLIAYLRELDGSSVPADGGGSPPPVAGNGLSREVWSGVTGTSVAAIPVNSSPSIRDTIASFEAPINWADQYGTRVRGYITAPATGNYTFWISSDDASELWLSTDASPVNKQRIAWVSTWTSSREWTREANQRSAAISLVAGQVYYVEALHKEGAGGDHLAVGWARPGQSTSAPGEIIPGSVLTPFDNPGSVTREVWTNVSGASVANIPVNSSPNIRDALASFEAPSNWADSYGTRVRGYITAPASGSYTFWIASDDNSELWLSPDANPGSKQRIAWVSTWTSSRQWNKEANQKSAAITLTAGQMYFVEALQKEAGGGDNLAVGWARPGESVSAPSEVIPGAVLSPFPGGGSASQVATAAAPVFSPAGGTYSSAQSVSITSTTSGAVIRYTADGTEPTAASTAVTGPLTVSVSITIRARAFATGMNPSPVTTASYTINVSTPANVLASDNFSGSSLSADWLTRNGNWQVSNGVLSQTSTAAQDPKKALLKKYGVTYPPNLMITAKVRVDVWGGGDGGRAGIALGNDETSGHGINLILRDGNTIRFLDDFRSWGPEYSFTWSPGAWYWFKLRRVGDVYSGKVWADGSTEPAAWPYEWTRTGRSGGLPGLNGGSGATTVSFDDVSIEPVFVLPSPWVSSEIGTSAAQTGSSSYESTTGRFTIEGGGADIWGTADQFRYVHQDASGDAEVSARVVSVENTDPWAKVGVMIRESTAPDSMFAMVVQRPDRQVVFQWRTATGMAAVSAGAPTGGTGSPKYVRVTRVGNRFRGFYKVNAADPWIEIGTGVDITMAVAPRVGLCVTAHTVAGTAPENVLCTAVFEEVSVTP